MNSVGQLQLQLLRVVRFVNFGKKQMHEVLGVVMM